MVKVSVGIIFRENRSQVLICQRKSNTPYPLKWEFPGGKVKDSESMEDCLHRELEEELGIAAEIGDLYHRQSYVYPDSGTFDVLYFLVPSYTGILINHNFETLRWVPVGELKHYDILEGNKPVVGKLMNEHA